MANDFIPKWVIRSIILLGFLQMYKIVLFSGGVYKFDELVETVEDVGGLVLKKDYFHISRGASYLSEEIQVMLIIPEKDVELIELMSQDIKGNISKLELNYSQVNNILTYLSVYNVLSRTDSWMTINEIKDLIQCPCPSLLCQISDNENCVYDELNDSLPNLCLQGVVISRKQDNKTEYQLK